MYKVIFEDGTSFNGGTFPNSLWAEMPDKPIIELYYYLGGNCLKMKGYERYNHLFEHVASLFTKQKKINGIYILGERKDCIERFYLNFKNAQLEHSFCKFGHEFRGGMSTGWKQGVNNQEPAYTILS
jgi:hypothetical protein